MGELEEEVEDEEAVAGNPFTFGSSATSQLVMERIMSQSVSNLVLLLHMYVYICRERDRERLCTCIHIYRLLGFLFYSIYVCW